MLINIIQIIKMMQIKIISKNKTNKHTFFIFLTRQGLTFVLRLIHNRKPIENQRSSNFEISLL